MHFQSNTCIPKRIPVEPSFIHTLHYVIARECNLLLRASEAAVIPETRTHNCTDLFSHISYLLSNNVSIFNDNQLSLKFHAYNPMIPQNMTCVLKVLPSKV